MRETGLEGFVHLRLVDFSHLWQPDLVDYLVRLLDLRVYGRLLGLAIIVGRKWRNRFDHREVVQNLLLFLIPIVPGTYRGLPQDGVVLGLFLRLHRFSLSFERLLPVFHFDVGFLGSSRRHSLASTSVIRI